MKKKKKKKKSLGQNEISRADQKGKIYPYINMQADQDKALRFYHS